MNKKILVVDDDQEWNFLLKIHLEKAGYGVLQAFDGEAAVKKVMQERPDLVILDINMPIMDGWDVCEKLRADTTTADLPIVIVSSYSQSDDIDRGKLFRVKRHILKPCLPKVVIQNVQDLLSQK